MQFIPMLINDSKKNLIIHHVKEMKGIGRAARKCDGTEQTIEYK